MTHPAVTLRRTRFVLIALWFVSSVALVSTLWPGSRDAAALALIAALGYLVGLGVYLAQTAPPDLLAPREGESPLLHGIGLLPMLGFFVAISLILMALSQTVGAGVALVGPSALLALWLVVDRRRQIIPSMVLWGLAAGLVTASSLRLFRGGDLSWALYNGVTTPILFVAGALLSAETHFGRVHSLEGGARTVLSRFALGCLYAAPPALLNLLPGESALDAWVTAWWHPLAALASGVGEEVWARLFLTTFLFAMLGPTIRDRPLRAVVVAIVLGAILHSAAYAGLDPSAILIRAVIYGVPAAILYITRDLETAIGFHFFADSVRFVAVLMTR